MKRLFSCVVLLVVLASPPRALAQNAPESPFYCNLSRLTSADRARKEDIARTLASRRLAVHERADGYEFVFPGDGDTFQMLSEWVVTERVCCPFFDFDLRLAREGGSMALRLSGRPGTKDFIKADFARWLK
jgi:hypothetical protein